MCYQFFAKNVHYLPPIHASRANSGNIVGRNPLMVIPLLANQDLTSMLSRIRVVTSVFVAGNPHTLDTNSIKVRQGKNHAIQG